jgi:catechol 2,3-dioxygenase-like lactoylglutathione lyase family enzyme
MIDHIGLDVSDIQRSKAFYAAALKPLGYELLRDHDSWLGLGAAGKPDLWINDAGHKTAPGIHIAFRAEDRATVDAFHAAALAAGATDNGAPGIRDIYHPNYYGAFVLDPDGHNVEAVCHTPE